MFFFDLYEKRRSSAIWRTSWVVSVVFNLYMLDAQAAKTSHFVHATSYSFDAPMDLYLSEETAGCEQHTQGLRRIGARVLGIVLYPDAFCSLVQGAACTYRFVSDPKDAPAIGESTKLHSTFSAEWSEACISAELKLPELAQGVLQVSEASDLGLQGTYDFLLVDGAHLCGVFDSRQCQIPRHDGLMCVNI